jgi:hypothetical protein
MHGSLRQATEEVALELAACEWSRLDLKPLRAYSFWILVGGGKVHNLMAPDGYGRPRIGMFLLLLPQKSRQSQLVHGVNHDHKLWHSTSLDSN